jgi:hypothetical protein
MYIEHIAPFKMLSGLLNCCSCQFESIIYKNVNYRYSEEKKIKLKKFNKNKMSIDTNCPTPIVYPQTRSLFIVLVISNSYQCFRHLIISANLFDKNIKITQHNTRLLELHNIIHRRFHYVCVIVTL